MSCNLKCLGNITKNQKNKTALPRTKRAIAMQPQCFTCGTTLEFVFKDASAWSALPRFAFGWISEKLSLKQAKH